MSIPEIVLHIWPEADGLESSSPFCLKILFALRYKHIPHRVALGPPPWTTTGRLPAVELAGRKLEDSSVILRALEEYGEVGPRLYPTDPDRRAEAVMLEDWCDDSFTLNMVYYRWTDDANFERLSRQAFAGLPAEKRDRIVGAAREYHDEMFRDRGIAQYSDEERLARFSDGLRALERRLEGGGPYLVGEQLTVADLAVYSTLLVIRAAELRQLVPLLADHPAIARWMTRMSGHCTKPGN